jgi:hypothetical protein
MTNTAIIRQLVLILAIGLLTLHGLAQENTLRVGDPPLASQITVTEVDAVTVNVVGEARAVFASAGVIVRNLYTGATATTIATGNGSFEIALSGTDGMPYQVNAVQTLPQTIIDPLPGVGTIVYPDYGSLREGQPIPFAIGGQLAYGAAVWFGEGQINQLNFNAGDELSLTTNIRMFLPVSESTPSYTMRGQIALRRLFDENGRQLSTAIGAGDNWSSELTPTGLPILGRHVPDTLIAAAETERLRVDDETGEASFRLEFTATIPDDLPAGIYVPVFTGQTAIADSEPFDWYANRIFSTSGENGEGYSVTVLPFVIRQGESEQPRINWLLTDDNLPIILGLPSVVPFVNGEMLGLDTQIAVRDTNLLVLPIPPNDFPMDKTPLIPDGWLEDAFDNRYVLEESAVVQYELAPITAAIILPGTPFEPEDTYTTENPFSLVVTNTANGVMGLADYDRSPQAWFDTRSYPTDAPDVSAFVNFPYFQGDVVYIPDGADSGLNPVLTGGVYQYLSIVRPDVTVRQFVRDSNATFDARVSNDDLLGGQVGAGSEGNRPGDVLFLFGGTVAGDDIRGYSALAVVTNEDSARVVPPFTEPLFSLRDEPIYMFVLPTGVRPGQVLEVGNKFVHVGYVAPTVAADVYTEIITPSGEVIQQASKASTFGYFYDEGYDFTVTEAGVYRVFTQASYNGITSAGQLNDTFTGHPLGAEEYFVFVVPEGEPMLTTPRENVSEVASGQTFTINVRAPETWTDVAAYYVVRTASTILEQGTLDTFANQTNYQFNWSQIARIFPNIESAATEPSDMDEITFSFAMTGLDANGNSQIQARVFTLRGNMLYTFDS